MFAHGGIHFVDLQINGMVQSAQFFFNRMADGFAAFHSVIGHLRKFLAQSVIMFIDYAVQLGYVRIKQRTQIINFRPYGFLNDTTVFNRIFRNFLQN